MIPLNKPNNCGRYYNAVQDTFKKFPNYLFGKVALAEYYINYGEHQKVPKVLNHKFQIHMHYPPSVKVFHLSEVRSFHAIVGRYYLRANKINRALFCYCILADMELEHPGTKQLGDEIVFRELGDLRKKILNRRR